MVSGRIKDLKYFMSELSLSLVLYGQIPTISLTQPPPFGGYKESGKGREGGISGLHAYVKLENSGGM